MTLRGPSEMTAKGCYFTSIAIIIHIPVHVQNMIMVTLHSAYALCR